MARRNKEESRPCKLCGTAIPISKTQCPGCRSFDNEAAKNTNLSADGFVPFSSCNEAEYPNRLLTGPWDINFGTHYDDNGKPYSGVADTTITLLGGKNGSGKSTLAMHMVIALIKGSNLKSNPPCNIHELFPSIKPHTNCRMRHVMYLSAEEGNNALRARAKRLGMTNQIADHLLLLPLGVKNDDLDAAFQKYKPRALIGDSISKLTPDTDKAVDFCDSLRPHCEELKMPAILINHINKQGDQSGLEALQHSVDAVLLFEIDTDKIRIIETIKNRNGEDGVKTLYSMTGKGLVLNRKAMQELEDADNDDDDDEDEDEENDEYEDDEDE